MFDILAAEGVPTLWSSGTDISDDHRIAENQPVTYLLFCQHYAREKESMSQGLKPESL